jgi:hypothetical protein
VSPPAASSDTPTTFSQFPSLPTIDKLFPARATEPSSSGTPSETANTPSPTRATLSGFRACDSAPTLRTPSLSALVGTRSSRYVQILAKLYTPLLRGSYDAIKKISICYFRASAMRQTFTISLIFTAQSFLNEILLGRPLENPHVFPWIFHNSPHTSQSDVPLTRNSIGLGTRHLQTPNRPHWTHRLHQHRNHLSRWIPLRIWWKGWYHHALGLERVQAPILPHCRR